MPFVNTPLRVIGDNISAKYQGFSSGGGVFLPPNYSELLAYFDGYADGELHDKLEIVRPEPIVVDTAVVNITAGDTITLTLVGDENVVSNDGVTPTITANTLTFNTDGYCANLVLSDGTILSMEETAGLIVYDSSGGGNHGTLSVDTRTVADVPSANLKSGYTLDGTTFIPALKQKSSAVATLGGVSHSTITTDNAVALGSSFKVTLRGVFDSDSIDYACLFANDDNSSHEGSILIERYAGISAVWIPITPMGMPRHNFTFPQPIFDGTYKDVEFFYDNGVGSLTVNGVTHTEQAPSGGGNLAANNIGILTRPTNYSRAVKGRLYYAEIETSSGTEIKYDVRTNIGKTNAVLTDSSSNSNDGVINVGLGGLDFFWSRRIPDTNGILVDAKYNLLQIKGGYVHNGFEGGLRYNDVNNSNIIDSLLVVDPTGGKCTCSFVSPQHYQNVAASTDIYWDHGIGWMMINSSTSEEWFNITETLFPPKTGWSIGTLGSLGPTIEYDSIWIEDGEFITVDYQRFTDHLNMTKQTLLAWSKLGTDICHVVKCLNYEQATIWSEADHAKGLKFSGDLDCGSVSAVDLLEDGTPNLLENGSVTLLET